MEYCYHVWAGAPSFYLEVLDKLYKRICRTVGPSIATCLKPLANRRNVFSINITLVDIHLNWLNWLHFLILEGGLLVILIDCMIFLLPFIEFKGCLCQQFLSMHSWALEFSAYRTLSFDL